MLTSLEMTLPENDTVFKYKVGWWKRLSDIVISQKRTQPAIKEWKQHCLWVSNSVFGRDPEDPFPEYKPSWPKLPEGTWLDPSSAIGDKERVVNAVEYCITRTMPSADGKACSDALEETRKTYCEFTPTPLSEEDKDYIRRNSSIAGAEVKACARAAGVLKRMHSHCSLTNKGCYELSSKQGGKKRAIIPGFHEWLSTHPDNDQIWELPTGGRFTVRRDTPRWRAEIPNIRDLPEAEIGTEIEQSGWLHPELVGMEEDRLAVLLHTYCYVTLVEEGFLTQAGRPTGKMFSASAVALGEPGGKARIPTKSQACLTTYLQPYAHVMRAVLETDPTLDSGLSAGNQAWEFVKDLQNSFYQERGSDLYEGVLLGDLERSTDFIEYEAGTLHMDSFWEPWTNVSNYFRYSHELILQPFVLETEGVADISARGALMGLPGTKIILHTISKAIDVAASRRTAPLDPVCLRRHTWRCAGDDIIRLGSFKELRRYKPSAVRYRVKPSDDKWGVYSKGGKYCERAVLLEGLFDTRNISDSFYQDIVPMRLLSPETKTRSGDDDTNPIFGKGHAFAREMEWYSGPEAKKAKALDIFLENMREYGDLKGIAFLPRHLGGLGLNLRTDLSFRYTPEIVKKAVREAYASKGTPKGELALRALQTLRTPLLMYRGEPIPLQVVENEMRWITEFLPVATTQEMRDNLDLPVHLRFGKACKRIEEHGYVDIGKILRETQAGERTPFWELANRKARKGWNTAPLNTRVKGISLSLPQLEASASVTFDEWSELLHQEDDLRPEPLWIHKDDMTVYADGLPMPLNLRGKATGLSLKMGIPNRTLFDRGDR